MFLVDSSAWVEYLRPKGSPKIKQRVRDLLVKEEAASCGIVAVEILRGARNRRDFDLLRETIFALPQIPIDEDVIQRASLWGFELDRRGETVSTTDLLIAAAAYRRATLLHLDSDFERIGQAVDLDEERLRV
ncbi:MAG: PIN domain-containing protein [Nitrospirota bacterium]